MSTILASASQAAAATTTTSAFDFNAGSVVTATCLNGTIPPSTPTQVQLQLSVDNSTWVNTDKRNFGMGPAITYYQTFRLGDYVGSQATTASGVGAPQGWLYYRLVFSNNPDQAVTISAADSATRGEVVLTLTAATTNAAGGMGTWTPPEGGPIIIEDCYVYCTASAGANSSMNAGVAANVTTASSNMIAAQMNAANNTVIVGNGGLLLTTTQALTFTATANSSPFAGKAYITYRKLGT